MFGKKVQEMTADVKKKLSVKKQRALMTLAGATATTPIAVLGSQAMASVDVSEIATQIFQWVGAGVIVLGIVILIVGIATFFSAEDDGPQKSKGKGQIAAGITSLAVGAAITAAAGTLADWVSSAFDS
ncbi:MAG: hypothetical protein ACI4CS_00870 [Candidatus Weimeria sp.]